MIENILNGLIVFGFILIGIGAIGDILSLFASNSFIEFRGNSCHFVNFSTPGALIVLYSTIALIAIG